MRITLTGPHDTIVMDGDGSLDHDLTILKDGVTGWYSTPAVREAGLDRPQQDGCYWPSRMTQPGRTISIHVLEHAISSVQAALMSQRLCALMGHALTLTVEDQLGIRTCTCWLADDPAAGMLVTQTAFECTLVLYCPDPYKYGPVQWYETSGRWCMVRNPGTAPSWPCIRCDGPLTRLRMALDDGEVRWEGQSSQGLTIDTRDMLVYEGRVSLDLSFAIGPGVHRVLVESDSPRVRIGVRPAWR